MKKSKLVNFRVSPRDVEVLAEVARECGLTKSDFLRQAIYKAAQQGQRRDGGQQVSMGRNDE